MTDDPHYQRACVDGAPEPPPAITRYYTFGFNHAHAVCGTTFDKDVVVQITAPNPRAIMFQWFGRDWSMEYKSLDEVDLSWYPRGIVELT